MFGTFRTSASASKDFSRDISGDQVGCMLMFVAAAALLVSTFFAWWDLLFLLRGQSTEGTVLFAEMEPHARHPHWKLDYHYRDVHGNDVKRRTSLPLSWSPPADGKLVVEYLPNDMSITRIRGIETHWALWFCGVSLLIVLAIVFKWFLEARSAVTMRAPRSWSPQQ